MRDLLISWEVLVQRLVFLVNVVNKATIGMEFIDFLAKVSLSFDMHIEVQKIGSKM